ncbi:hypothetical protein SADUNF_Sadunf16G0112600 [Salix dunnii]|uniref:Cytochrome c domain-containing protein n=1 Tax=Salix dunnii TaxID=1413687 RepID=A0A835J851_9ROSI|nr:hypothetical protein SADUNF_Sadunf16G0112600 [Salix dunnii]
MNASQKVSGERNSYAYLKKPSHPLLLAKPDEMASFAEAHHGDSKVGEKIFKIKCVQCHTVDKGAGHKQGLNLNGLFGTLAAFPVLCADKPTDAAKETEETTYLKKSQSFNLHSPNAFKHQSCSDGVIIKRLCL